MTMAKVVSVAKDTFKPRKAGEKESTMFKIFLADERGEVGFAYSAKECKEGDAVGITYKVRDGRLVLKLVVS